MVSDTLFRVLLFCFATRTTQFYPEISTFLTNLRPTTAYGYSEKMQASWYEYHPSTPSGSRTARPDGGIFIPTRLEKMPLRPGPSCGHDQGRRLQHRRSVCRPQRGREARRRALPHRPAQRADAAHPKHAHRAWLPRLGRAIVEGPLPQKLRLIAPAHTRDGRRHKSVAVCRPRVAEVVVQRGGALHLQQQVSRARDADEEVAQLQVLADTVVRGASIARLLARLHL